MFRFPTLVTATALAGILLVWPSEVLAKTKKARTGPSTTLDGAGLVARHCAACHGQDAKGNGPAAGALKVAPPDLTRLSERNGGKFPDDRLSRIISGDQDIDAHGSRTMPMWGTVFRSMSPGTPQLDTVRIKNLIDYLQSIQAK